MIRYARTLLILLAVFLPLATPCQGKVIPLEIWFNWGSDSGAVGLYEPCTGSPLDTPEYQDAGRNNPCAYVRNRELRIRVRFSTDEAIGQTKIKASGAFGGLPQTTVQFQDGVSSWIEFTAKSPIPDVIGVYAVVWKWSHSVDGGQTWTSMGETTHQLYALNRQPTTPIVYKELAEWTSEWCAGQPDDVKALADAILAGFAESGVLKYGEEGWDTAELLCTGDGMCGGMKEVFYDALRTQGYDITRMCFILKDATPGRPYLWQGMVVKAPGLGQTEPTYPARTCLWVDEQYPKPVYGGAQSLSDDVEAAIQKVYTFYAPLDGHCVNLLDYAGHIFLYDLSFGTGPWADPFPAIPQSGYYRGAELHDFRANYHDQAVDHMYGLIYYESEKTGRISLNTYFDVSTRIIPDTLQHLPLMRYRLDVVEAGAAAVAATGKAAAPKIQMGAGVAPELRALMEDISAPVAWLDMERRLLQLDRTPGHEAFLAALLKRSTPVLVTRDQAFPGVMPPLAMLQSAAILTLQRWGATGQIPALLDVARATGHQSLRRTALEAVQALRATKP